MYRYHSVRKCKECFGTLLFLPQTVIVCPHILLYVPGYATYCCIGYTRVYNVLYLAELISYLRRYPARCVVSPVVPPSIYLRTHRRVVVCCSRYFENSRFVIYLFIVLGPRPPPLPPPSASPWPTARCRVPPPPAFLSGIR